MKSKGETYEGVAFQFCKVATVTLVAGRFALPVAATLCALFYILAFAKGKRDTRCIGRYPLAIAAFWVLVSLAWLVWTYDVHDSSRTSRPSLDGPPKAHGYTA